MDWIVPISVQERATGVLSPSSLRAARDLLDQLGCVVLRGVFATDFIDNLRAAFDAQWGNLDADAMHKRSELPAPRPVLNVGLHRYEVLLQMKGAFADPRLFANPLLCRVLLSVLDEGMKLSGVTAVASYPGAEMQHIHSDHPALFPIDSVSASLPHYAINVAAPLIDVSLAMGTTGIFLGSHRWPKAREPKPQNLTAVEFLRGDCVLIDYRTRHMGLPNRTNTVRPILYMVYARPWFFDEANHIQRPSLHMDVAEFAALPDGVKPLVQRAYSLQMRARYFNAAS